jgi:signal transduction histidine kinase
VRQLVELHGGRVTAHSDGCDRGTELTAWFPLGAGGERVAPSNGAGLERKLA